MKGKIYKILKYILVKNPLSSKLLKIPSVNLIGWKLYSNFVKLYLKIMEKIKPEKYDARDPFKIHWIDPNEIKYKVKDEKPNIPFPGYGIKMGGDWDKNPEKIEESKAYKKIEKVLNSEKEPDLSKERIREIIDLKKSLEKQGYKTQEQLFEENPEETILRSNDSPFPHANEIQICVGRNGEKYWTHKGQVRLIVSKMLELKKIPVVAQFSHN